MKCEVYWLLRDNWLCVEVWRSDDQYDFIRKYTLHNCLRQSNKLLMGICYASEGI